MALGSPFISFCLHQPLAKGTKSHHKGRWPRVGQSECLRLALSSSPTHIPAILDRAAFHECTLPGLCICYSFDLEYPFLSSRLLLLLQKSKPYNLLLHSASSHAPGWDGAPSGLLQPPHFLSFSTVGSINVCFTKMTEGRGLRPTSCPRVRTFPLKCHTGLGGTQVNPSFWTLTSRAKR